ncbi:hypothetical protein K440DRAFT_98380 [Wilcoxina mikolae CBS 423.85]|nr:hypothetical protein K440DRAFT_98380 [Wilcoxina mikolae CBS 423.85]
MRIRLERGSRKSEQKKERIADADGIGISVSRWWMMVDAGFQTPLNRDWVAAKRAEVAPSSPASHPNSLTPCLLQTSFFPFLNPPPPLLHLLLLHRHHHLLPPSFSHRQRPSQFSQSTAFHRSRTPLNSVVYSFRVTEPPSLPAVLCYLVGLLVFLVLSTFASTLSSTNADTKLSRKNNYDSTYNNKTLKFASELIGVVSCVFPEARLFITVIISRRSSPHRNTQRPITAFENCPFGRCFCWSSTSSLSSFARNLATQLNLRNWLV